ncbi:peroxidase 2-like [Typha angustifolia]|uniref:peroxidase 2-like n=1 Tax=Typha angustifolia TaxID=59011 RepID=UPI003C2C2C85
MRSERTQLPLLASCLLFAMVIQAMLPLSSASLQVGYYRYTCPKAEKIVKRFVRKAISDDVGLAAGLIRLFFHDCFVRGCDASVLLDPTPENPHPEKTAPINDPSLEGFDLVDKVKAALERHCPGVVSCADIIAFAARDATKIAGGFHYAIPSGRRDGRVSLAAESMRDLPDPTFNLDMLKENFAVKGLNLEDMVVLSGAHTIGDSHCSSFLDRLKPGVPIDASLAASLKKKCPSPASGNVTVDQDVVTPDLFDNQYYKNVEAHRVLFDSDNALLTSKKSADLVSIYARDQTIWQVKFAAAMVKMGHIGVRVGKGGEIRKMCRVVN